MLELVEVLETEVGCSECHLYLCPDCLKPFRGIVSRVESGEIKMCDTCRRKADAAETKEKNRILLEEKKAKAIADDLELAARVRERDETKRVAHEARCAIMLENRK